LRLGDRGQDSQEIIDKRMQAAAAEMSHYGEFDFIVINDKFEHALRDLCAIVSAQRSRNANQIVKWEHLLLELTSE